MEHDIGCKIKAARIEKKLTQEQVAELLGVSRQTISNWENEKSYPDIISVIKMSECYDVSLDYLLKGEQKMKSYYDYLEESTNVVKSNANRNKIITILSYLLIWAFAMIVRLTGMTRSIVKSGGMNGRLSRTAIWKLITARSEWTCVLIPDRGLILSLLSMRELLSGRWKSGVSRRISAT